MPSYRTGGRCWFTDHSARTKEMDKWNGKWTISRVEVCRGSESVCYGGGESVAAAPNWMAVAALAFVGNNWRIGFWSAVEWKLPDFRLKSLSVADSSSADTVTSQLDTLIKCYQHSHRFHRRNIRQTPFSASGSFSLICSFGVKWNTGNLLWKRISSDNRSEFKLNLLISINDATSRLLTHGRVSWWNFAIFHVTRNLQVEHNGTAAFQGLDTRMTSHTWICKSFDSNRIEWTGNGRWWAFHKNLIIWPNFHILAKKKMADSPRDVLREVNSISMNTAKRSVETLFKMWNWTNKPTCASN